MWPAGRWGAAVHTGVAFPHAAKAREAGPPHGAAGVAAHTAAAPLALEGEAVRKVAVAVALLPAFFAARETAVAEPLEFLAAPWIAPAAAQAPLGAPAPSLYNSDTAPQKEGYPARSAGKSTRT